MVIVAITCSQSIIDKTVWSHLRADGQIEMSYSAAGDRDRVS